MRASVKSKVYMIQQILYAPNLQLTGFTIYLFIDIFGCMHSADNKNTTLNCHGYKLYISPTITKKHRRKRANLVITLDFRITFFLANMSAQKILFINQRKSEEQMRQQKKVCEMSEREQGRKEMRKENHKKKEKQMRKS